MYQVSHESSVGELCFGWTTAIAGTSFSRPEWAETTSAGAVTAPELYSSDSKARRADTGKSKVLAETVSSLRALKYIMAFGGSRHRHYLYQ